MADFHAVADAVAADIASGKLAAGARLPPQRIFAHQRGIAVSTASRVYAELVRRGLVVGEVGRGTFVRAPDTLRASLMVEANDAPIDLQVAMALSLEQAALLAPALKAISGPAGLYGVLDTLGPFGPKGAGEIAAGFLKQKGWTPDASGILFPSGGRQAIASAVAALCKPGDRIGVEPLTFPSIIRTAQQLGIHLVPIPVDSEGIDIAALTKVHLAKPLTAIYIQPSVHNPLGITMSATRREDLAKALRKLELMCIEDAVYAFLSGEAPLAVYCPDRVILIDSMQKRIGPGVGLGLIAAPPSLKNRIAAAMRAGGWVAPSLVMRLGLSWLADGTAARVADLKRRDANARQSLAAKVLAGANIVADKDAFHLWLELPEPWRADTFVSAAALRGVAVTPASAFTVSPGHAPNAVRIAISGPPVKDLERGLNITSELLRGAPSDSSIE
jgi:DNA-binding transcriptional MocR family regulator